MTLALLLVEWFAPPASAMPELGREDHCTYGWAKSVSNSFYPHLWKGSPQVSPFADVDAAAHCSFRTFVEPPEGICFDERDSFVGGIVASESDEAPLFPELGLTARESVQSLEVAFTVTAPAGAEWETYSTPAKGLGQVNGTKLAWSQHGLIFTTTPTGEYSVESEYDHPAEAVYGEFPNDVVSFTVLPHEVARDLGRPSFGALSGSVNCP